MYCVKCGKQLPDDMAYCTECGMPTGKNAQGNASNSAKNVMVDPTQTIAADAMDSSQPVGSPGQQTAQQVPVVSAAVNDNQEVNQKPLVVIAAILAVVIVVGAILIFQFVRSSGEPADTSSTASQTVVIDSNKTGEDESADADSEDANTVTLSVKTADGESLSGQVRRDDNGFVLPESSNREYSYDEISSLGLSDAELCIAWNEPFARQGYHFKNPDLQQYFESCPWYTDTYNSSYLSGVAATNNSTLRSIAESNSQSAKWLDLATS